VKHPQAHLRGTSFAHEIDLSCLSLGIIHNLREKFLMQVRLRRLKLRAAGVHLGQHGLQAAGPGLRAHGVNRSEAGENQ